MLSSANDGTPEYMGESLAALRTYLAGIPTGCVSAQAEIETIESLLSRCWDELVGDLGGMKTDKLFGRMKEMDWNPPLLTFRIVRHGPTALGSKYGIRQDWTIDVSAGTKTVAESKVLVGEPQPKLDVKPMAEEVVGLILAGKTDKRLKWDGEGRVRIRIGKIIPDRRPAEAAQTLQGRRKRVMKEIENRLREHGWLKTGTHTFEKRLGDEKTGARSP